MTNGLVQKHLIILKKMNKKVPFKNDFDKAKKLKKIRIWLLYISSILLIINFLFKNNAFSIGPWIERINSLIIIVFLSLEILVAYFHLRAEKQRRQDMIDNSFGSLVAEERTNNYYSNDKIKNGLYKMGVNSFESCYFSYNIAKEELSRLWFKSIILSIIFVLLAICGYSGCVMFFIQLSIPVVLIQQSIHHTIFVSKLNTVCERYRSLFDSLRDANDIDNSSIVILNILEYEAALSWGNILLNEKIYEKMNESLSEKWNHIKEEYSIL